MITSVANQRVKEARKLHRRRGRYASGLLFLEGVRLVRDAWQSGVRPQTVFYVPDFVQQNSAALQLIAELQAGSIECLTCTEAVFSVLSDTVTPQGIGAIVPMPVVASRRTLDLALILDRVRDPGNAGSLLRTGEAAGVDLVIFAPHTVDPFNDKVMRAGMGAHFRMPVHVADKWQDVHAQIGDLHVYVADLKASISYDQVDWREPSALIIGGEARGASMAAEHVVEPIAIPMIGGTESLNAAVAGAVILFEAARQRRA